MGNSMFASFKSSDEYQKYFKQVLTNTIKGNEMSLIIFIERLRTTIIEEQKNEREV